MSRHTVEGLEMEFTPPYIYVGLAADECELDDEIEFLDSIKFVTDLERARALYEEWCVNRRGKEGKRK